jgi:2',3'-cyclic-nucleotide 2'-phosphodiesterase (5'-nucleotidase family)
MRSLFIKYSFLFAVVLAVSCQTIYQPSSVQYKDYRISAKQTGSKDINALLQPYSDSVNRNMNDVIAVAGVTLDKKQPEGTLGNILADAMLIMAKENYKTTVDLALINAGGIRLPTLPAGNITRGKIFEMAPFDNILVLLKVKGEVLQQLLDVAAAKGGWPAAGVSYQLKNKKATNIVIGGTPLKADAVYTIALVDYIANGGDNCDMLREIPQQNNGYLFRDAVIQYFARQHQQGKEIKASIENRVTNAE